MRATTETDLVKQVIDYLTLNHWVAWRNNTGARPWVDRKGNNRLMRFGAVGSGDVFALRGGVFLSIECKSATGRVTTEQMAWIDKINRQGGSAFVVRSLEDLIRALERIEA